MARKCEIHSSQTHQMTPRGRDIRTHTNQQDTHAHARKNATSEATSSLFLEMFTKHKGYKNNPQKKQGLYGTTTHT